MMRRLLPLLVALQCAALAWAVSGAAGPYRLEVTTDPAVVPIGRATLRLKVTDASGRPVTGADVRTLTGMPGMFMGEREQQAIPVAGEPGVYTSPAQFPMAGAYEVKVTIQGPAGRGEGVVPMEPGRSTVEGGRGVPWGAIALSLGAVALLVLVAHRMRKTGQSLDPRPLLSRQVLVPLLVLGGAVALSVYAVNRFRRPGAMTPIEAQVMEMNVPAPEGTSAVVLATVTRAPFVQTVRYAGQAAAYQEQEVVPRVQGVIQWMPFYLGDRVRKGQLLARLDTSQLEPEVKERSAEVAAAQEGVVVAGLEFQQALNEVAEAQAEAAMARSQVEEARAELAATQQGRAAAEAQVANAEAEVETAQAEVAAAEADERYWNAQVSRAQSLFESGAISRQQLQREQAEAQKAEAALRRAREGVKKAQTGVTAARAEVRRVDAQIQAAQKKVQQAEAGLRAQEARVRTARTGADAAKQRAAQARAAVRQASAGLQGAATMRGYTALRAEIDGVVTQRFVSPGGLAIPGQPILRIAQIQPIRIQANVPESELERVQIGAPVRVWHRGKAGAALAGRVASISPAVDPGARTGVVEARLPNADLAFQPGQFVTMELSLGRREPRLAVPESAVRFASEEEGAAGGAWVWVAEPIPGQEGRFTVARREVEVGERAGDRIAIRSGLEEGDRVVARGGGFLRAGQVVTAAEAPSKAASAHTVTVTDEGFKPARVTVSAGAPARLTFVRKTESTCGERLVIPALKIERDLPLDRPVTVELPPQQEGQVSFTCGMDMMKGTVIVR